MYNSLPRFRNMLSAAHILAMDAKNLLDVVDSIRIRFPDLFVKTQRTARTPVNIPTASETQQSHHISVPRSVPYESTVHHISPQMTDSSYEMMAQQTYQNMTELNEQLASETHEIPIQLTSSTSDDFYVNQQQIQQQQEQISGIYDNECIINAQLKKLNVTDGSNENDTTKSSSFSTKPPVAAKPTNLQQKLKPNTNSATGSTTSSSLNDKPLDESLKIIENEQDLYCNTKMTE